MSKEELNRIEAQFAKAKIKRCEEQGCSLKLAGLPNHVALKGETIISQQRGNNADLRMMCDCIIFTADNQIGIVELKSKTVYANDIQAKLQNGSNVALGILKQCQIPIPLKQFRFYHILLSKRLPSIQIDAIKTKTITVEGKKECIIAKKCGVSFAEIINRFQ